MYSSISSRRSGGGTPGRLSFFLFLCFFSLAWTALRAQDGWELLARDEHRAARAAFEQRLQADSLDRDALKGMLILTEMQGDKLVYERLLTRLITNYWEEPVYRVFEDDYEGSDTLVDASPMSEGAKVGARMSLASEHYRFRNPEQGDAMYRRLTPQNRWSLMGPFKNVAGSGYLTQYPVEKEPFRPEAFYRDETGVDLQWVRPPYTRTSGIVDFDDHTMSGEATRYANTFLELPEDRVVQMRLSRSSPISIWVDDALVFTSRERIGFYFDAEIIELPLKKGAHRILVKLSAYDGVPESYDLLEINYSGWSGRFDQARFCLRFTDSAGVSIPGIRLNYEARYKPARHTATLRKESFLDHFLARVEADPGDLFACYALCRAYMATGRSEEGEEYFVRLVRGKGNNVLNRWLLARLYAMNGKIEKVYATLEKIDPAKTPVFGLLYEKFGQIDMDSDEENYLASLGLLREIAPSSYRVIGGYLDYYSRKDMNKENDAFVDEMIAAWPDYKERLERRRTDYKSRSEIDERTPGEINDSLVALLKTEVDISAYDEVIAYYIDKEDVERVIGLYDEIIDAFPSWNRYRFEKAEYLVEEKRYDEAIETLEDVLKVFPYDVDAYEDIGDAYRDNGDAENALKAYRNALRVSFGDDGVQRSWSENSIVEKIDNLSKAGNPRRLFRPLSFDEALASGSWKEEFADEESAILLYTKEQMMDTTGRIRTWQKIMIGIITEAGADWWTEYDFSFLGDINTVKVLKESGGEVVPDRRGGYVVFKDLKPGDIIQLEGLYVESPDAIFDGEYFDLSSLSFSAPIHRARVEVLVPEGRYIGYRYHNLEDKLVKSARDGFDTYLWDYADLPKEPYEDAMLDGQDGNRMIYISTMRDWSRVADWYIKKTYRRCEAPYDVREALDSVVTAGMTDAQKVEAVYNYVTRRINYSYVPFFQSAYTPKFPDRTLSAGIGDCKDVATLMITMLRTLGIESYYTLVKTNFFNHQQYLPCHWFDHVIVAAKVNGEMKFMDLTTNFYPHYTLPEGDMGAWGLLVKEGETNIFQLPNDRLNPDKNLIEIDVEATLDTNRSIALNVKALHRGNEAGMIREGLVQMSKEELRNYILELMGKGTFQDLRLSDYGFERQFDISEPLESRYTFSGSRFSDRVSNLYIFRIPYMVAIRPSQALQSDTRTNRLDVSQLCGVAPSRQRVTIRFPEGYRMTELPENINVESEFGLYRVNYTQTSEGLLVEKYQQFHTSVVTPDKFDEFREFYLRILDLDEGRYAIIRQKL